MRYPKNKVTAFIRFSENEIRQVNIHKGTVYNYWFIQPHKKPFKMQKGQVPDFLKGRDLGDLGSF